MSRSSSATGSEAFELRYSVWDSVCSACPEEEAYEMKTLLGESLVEEASDLLSEANILLDIWRQMREAGDPGGPHEKDIPLALQEPPGLRETLLREINFLIKHIQEKNGGLPECSALSPTVLEYTNTNGDPERSSRPSSAISKDGRETPIRCTPTIDNGCSTPSELTVPQSLTQADISDTVLSLQEALRAECDQRKRDIDFLQECIDKEMEYSIHVSTATATPSIKELRAVSQHLEQQILSSSSSSNSNKLSQKSQLSKAGNKTFTNVTPPPIIRRSAVQVNRASRIKKSSNEKVQTTSFLHTCHPSLTPQSSYHH